MKFASRKVLMYYIVKNPKRLGEVFMNDIIKFFKELFMLKSEDSIKVGLAQFKSVTPIEKAANKKVVEPKKEVKLSDLMRRSY